MKTIEINDIEIAAIKSRAERGLATSEDCLELVRYIDNTCFTEDWINEITSIIESTLEGMSSSICNQLITRLQRTLELKG